MSDTPHISLPFSKSILTRVITISALSGKPLESSGVSDDTDYLARAFSQLLADRSTGTITDIYIGDGAAPLRFFIAAAASMKGSRVRIDGSHQLARRPHNTLISALRQAGAIIKTTTGLFPIEITGTTLSSLQPIEIDSSVSSQYASALMMVAPMWTTGVTLRLTGQRHVSLPYLRLTAEMMRQAGVDAQISGNSIRIEPGKYDPHLSPDIECDWSAASYFYEYTALTGNPLILDGLTPAQNSLQGDSLCANLFEKAGVRTRSVAEGLEIYHDPTVKTSPFEADMTECPDLVPALAVTLALNGTPFRLHGVSHLKHKESDRLEAITTGLSEFGVNVKSDNDSLSFDAQHLPTDRNTPIEIDTHSDHRIAMAFAITRSAGFDVRLSDDNCTTKSFPDFKLIFKKLCKNNCNNLAVTRKF